VLTPLFKGCQHEMTPHSTIFLILAGAASVAASEVAETRAALEETSKDVVFAFDAAEELRAPARRAALDDDFGKDEVELSEEDVAFEGVNLRGSVANFITNFWSTNTTAATNDNMTMEGSACVGQQGWDYDFANRLFGCGMRHLGVMPGCGRCMARRQRVSQACGACLGRLISCGKGCIWQCCAGRCLGRRACDKCNQRKCVPSFRNCAGVSPPTR